MAYEFPVPRPRGYQCEGVKQPPPGAPQREATDMFMHGAFARITFTNNDPGCKCRGETYEFNTKFDPTTKTIELCISEEHLEEIESINIGEKLQRFFCRQVAACVT